MNTNCAICITPVQDSTNIIVADCGHTFHCLCLMTNVAVGCPHCQASDDNDDDDVEDGFTPIFRFRRFLDADADDSRSDDVEDADNDEAEEEEQWGAESDSCDEFGSGYGAVEDSDDDDVDAVDDDDADAVADAVTNADAVEEEHDSDSCDAFGSVAVHDDNDTNITR